MYYSHVYPAALEACAPHGVGVANQWSHENGMFVNESKHQGLVLGDTEYSFSFPVADTLDTFGMEIGDKLNFSSYSHVALSKLIRKEILLKLYKAYIYLIFIIALRSGTFVKRAIGLSFHSSPFL